MNIMIIGTTDILGGAAMISWNIKTALEKDGHTVSMFVADKRSDDPNVKIIHRSKWRKVIGFLLGTENLISTDWIINTQEFKKADIVHCHNIHGRFFNLNTLQKMSLLKPVVWTLHDEWAITPHCACTMESQELKNGLYTCPSIDTPPRILWDNTKALSKYKTTIYNKAKFNIVTPSQWLLSRVKNTVLSKQNLQLINNGIDISLFSRSDKDTARSKLELPKEVKIILLLADNLKNNPWKGWSYAKEVINKFNHRNDVIFVVIGNDIDKTDGNVIYKNYVKNKNELALYYSASDILLFTSIAENFPLVVLEAMSCGLPIVSFNVGGVREAILHMQTGYIARYKNNDDLIIGLNWILEKSKNELNTISNISIKIAKEKYSIDRMTNEYITLYNKLINE